MIDITANEGKRSNATKGGAFRLKADAEAAAVKELGPQAIKEFDFVTYKCDGAWMWRPTAEGEKKPTEAMIKANGGRKSLLAMAAQIAGVPIANIEAAVAGSVPQVEAAKVTKLPVPPRRVMPQAPKKAAGAADGTSGTQPPSNEKAPAPHPGDTITLPDGSTATCIGSFTLPGCTLAVGDDIPGLDGAKVGSYADLKASGDLRSDPVPAPVDADGIPPFLQRTSTAEEKEAVRRKLARSVGPGRAIKDPPSIKAAVARAEKAKAKEAKFEGSPAHKKAADAAKKAAQDNARAPAKRTGAPRKAAATLSSGKTKNAMVGELLARPEGCTTADILAATGWPSVSVPAQAKAVGLTLRKEKDGKVTRYWGS